MVVLAAIEIKLGAREPRFGIGVWAKEPKTYAC